MKKGLIIIAFLTFSLAGFAQEATVATNDTNLVETVKTEQPEAKKATISAETKAKVLKLNHKKSNEIISIKAYRKSLHIKVKTVKLC
ncbi:hypothetical protein [Winogradskyella ursingii]|uniref:hypothetical protein n=1 Tax=Winogradskyella ursingii TaxID=2686079 RepID=UPI0015C95CA7|nr:hypothetical protein [Winogradskyella ursingii]